jgi:hypothetical protein
MVTMSLIGVSEVRELVRSTAPAVSVYLGPRTDPAGDDDRELFLRRCAITRDLSWQGADRASIDAVAQHLAVLGSTDRAMIVRNGEIVLSHDLPGAVAYDLAAFGAPARVTPLLSWLQSRPAYVRAFVDRRGADLVTVPAGATQGSHDSIDGPDDDARRFPGGGQLPRMQRQAEDSWMHNARAVTQAVAEHADRVHARLLLLGGEDRAVKLVAEQLRDFGRTPRIAVLAGTRHNPADDDAAHVKMALEQHVRAENAGRTAEILDGLGRRGAAVAGIEQTLTALDQGRLRALVVVDDRNDVRNAWTGTDLLCSAYPRGCTAPESWVRAGRMVDVAVRAALLTRADVRVLSRPDGAELPGGIGGLLRSR